nr:sigma-70 family RNA polymerase sigma factor [uncultured Blautia sp.]
MYCTNCGKEIDEGGNYCSYCGHKITCKKEGTTEITKEQLEEAVQRFQSGEETAFETIYKGVAKTAFILVNSFFPEEKSEHEDIVQDIFIHVYKKIDLYNPELASFTTWFHKVAENKCIDRHRKIKKKEKNISTVSMESLTVDEDGKKNVEFEDERIEFNPAAVMERNEVSSLIRELMEQLPEKQKQCLMLKFLAHYDIQEIAAKLDIPIGTVKSRLFKGKENLSVQVYAMEKRGIKLYNMSPVAFFVWLLTQEVEAEASVFSASNIIALAADPSVEIVKGLGQPSESSMTTTDAHTTETIGGHAEIPPVPETTPINGIAANAVSSGAAGKVIAVKVIGAIAGVSLLAGGGFAIANAFEHNKQTKQPDTVIEEPETNRDVSPIPLNSLFDDEEKKKQLENILAVAPVFDKSNPFDAAKLWDSVFSRSLTNIITLKLGATDLPVSPITDLDDIEVDTAKSEVILPAAAYDAVFEALDISSEMLRELEGQGLLSIVSDKMHLIAGQGALGPYTASISKIEEVEDTLEVSFALSYDSADPDIPPSNGEETYLAVIKSSDNSLGYEITSVKSENTSQLDIFQSLIDAYGIAYYAGLEYAPDYIDDNCGIFNPYHGMPLTPEDASEIYYALYDINGDGFEECFFTSDPGTEKTEYPGYYDIWTNDGIETHHVLAGGYRSFQIIAENGEIISAGSGSAFSGAYDVYSFTSKGEPQVIDSYLYESYDDKTAAEIDNFLKKYPQKDITLEWVLMPATEYEKQIVGN